MADAAEFSAHAFHASLPKGRASGTLRVYGHGLVFSSGTQSVTLPLQGLELKLGGAGNRLVFCSHAACPGWQVYTADRQLLKAPALANSPALRRVTSAALRGRVFGWGLLFGSIATVVLLGFLTWWSLDALSAVAARRVPVEWEDKLGKSVIAQYRLGHEFMDEKQAAKLLQPLTAPLVAALPDRQYTLHFYVVNDPAINAFALPGGYVVINSALILRADRAEELQGVLGHEISHVTQQHGLRAVIRSTGVYVIAQTLIGDASGLVAVLANAGPLLLNQKYSRDFEREADRKGYELLKRAQIDPRGMVDFFRTVLAEEKKQLAKIGDDRARQALESAQGFIGSHPETEERIATLQKRLAQEPKDGWRNSQTDFLALKAQVRDFVSEKAAAEGRATEAADKKTTEEPQHESSDQGQ